MSNRKQVSCICAQCNKIITKDLSEVTRNKKLRRLSFCSISCSVTYRNLNDPKFQSEEYKKSFVERMAKSVKPIKHDEYSPFKEFLRRIRMRYKENINKFYDVTLEDLKRQWDCQKGICPYSGIHLILKTSNDPIYKASLDRIDSSKGYIVGNIQFVSQAINYMKNSLSHEDTIKMCKIIASNYKL